MPTATKKTTTAKTTEQPKKYVSPNQIVHTNTAGGNISQYPVEFTKDSKYLFSAVGSNVKIYSMATGAVVKVISQSVASGGHNNKITCVVLNPKNPLQLYTASLDGTIKLWDYNDDILLKTYNVNAPIEHMVMSPKQTNHAYLVVNSNDEEDKTADNTVVYRFSFDEEEQSTHMRRICSLRDCTSIDITEDGQWLAMGARFKVYLWPVNNESEDVPETQFRQHIFVEQVTVLKFHPFKPTLSVGDRSGKITHIANYHLEDEKQHIRSINHWHHLPVRCLTFMADGSYLLSGGEEAVMVIWQLETGHKQFLPRLGGSIASIRISPNHRFYCVGLDDNSIRLVNSITQSIEQVIQGLQYAQAAGHHANNPLSTGLIVEPRNHHVVLNGVQGSLQFYDAVADSHVMDLEVVPMNRIVRSGEKEIVHAHVAHVAFLPTGEWMATVDMRDDKITTPELFLKFWRWDPDTQAYKLHTRVDYPHSKPITSLTFNPVSRQGPMAITTSKDKTFKVWNLSTDLGRAYTNGEAAWICRSVGVYRDSAPSAVSFSEDGSILAVAFGQAITIWDPYLNSIQAVLAQPNPEDIEQLNFLGDPSPFLVVKSKSHLYVWNLLTCKVWWSYKMTIDHLAVDTASHQFAVVRNHARTNQARVTVFDPKTPTPLALQHLDDTCLSIAWLSRENSDTEQRTSTLLCLNNKYEIALHVVKARDTALAVSKKESQMLLDNAPETNLLNDMYGKREAERETDEQMRIRLKTAQAMREEAMSANKKTTRRREDGDLSGLSAPSHVLPGVDSLFDSFMSTLMQLRLDPTEELADTQAMELDEQDEQTQHQDEKESLFFLQDNITAPAQQDFPQLSSFFNQTLEQKPVVAKAIIQDSSSDEDSDEEDPSNIDW
ncbi:WD repeat-containing protein 75 [Choanephora cucurbitarum]|uniref:WD repeat-containing protein 75 n=1 Tax=Choanephora cucurbitarum TaxID=101091 RepID=A0A1C7NCG6_9FUNG|nr:WD repeat-containing protein 75 [Choanephora cucurbitarum]